MRCYLIRNDEVTVYINAPKSGDESAIVLHSIKDLDPSRFPMSRLALIWNILPGVSPVKRFTDRKSALKRLWGALEALPISGSRSNSKQAKIISMLRQPSGASIDDLMEGDIILAVPIFRG
jgi:hypothetical protein